MCTAITLQSEQMENFFGRTMDFSYDIDPHLYIVPRNYIWTNTLNVTIQNTYSFIGIGQEIDNLLGFFDGVNEKGFAAATLYFAGYAKYDIHLNMRKQQPMAAMDFLHFILGKCGSIYEFIHIVNDISLVGTPDPITNTIAPLHWIATDATGSCVVIEQTLDGLKLHSNPIGVMANSPDFTWHMTNLRNYMNVSPYQNETTYWSDVSLRPFGQGAGTTLLPGGYTSPERFVRVAFQKTHITKPKDAYETVIACFHIMESVSIPKGIVITGHDTADYTKYTAFMDTNTCRYYIKTYNNSQITTTCLWDYNLNTKKPILIGTLNRPLFFDTFSLVGNS